jgi:hypothetical protein
MGLYSGDILVPGGLLGPFPLVVGIRSPFIHIVGFIYKPASPSPKAVPTRHLTIEFLADEPLSSFCSFRLPAGPSACRQHPAPTRL